VQLIPDSEFVHVVIGIVQNTKQQVLVSTRKHDVHQGGLLEFPGGKVEKNETAEQALRRELQEEINISCKKLVPLIQIPYTYEDRNIFLDVFRVMDHSGSVHANESQILNWIDIKNLDIKKFPNANHGIIKAIQLPSSICITPSAVDNEKEFILQLEKIIHKHSTSIFQLRSHNLNELDYLELAKKCSKLCNKYQTKLILNRELEFLQKFAANGLHLTSTRLMELSERPASVECLDADYLMGASCHTTEEVSHASAIGLDYIFLGPVIEKVVDNKLSAINLNMGWEKFNAITRLSLIPVYAIGGLKVADQEVAAIRDFWSS